MLLFEVVEDSSEEEYGHLAKRSRSSALFDQQRNSSFPVSIAQYNPLHEPSPLGLRLRKSPSLIDLIQMKLSKRSTASTVTAPGEKSHSVKKRDVTRIAASCANDKWKASNFPALLLRIGSWEFISKCEGDLVAKFYFAKEKLVWEVLDDGLKQKIEIQWSDIMDLKANCPDNGPSTLNIVLAHQPHFFQETNPKPRKHTNWQACDDFTHGQAEKNRQHYLQCPPGVLNKHFEKLIQCDTHLCLLSRQPVLVMESPYFDSQASGFENSEASKGDKCNIPPSVNEGSSSSPFRNVESGAASSPPSFSFGWNPLATQHVSKEAPSPNSGPGISETQRVPGLFSSMLMNDLVNHSEILTYNSLPYNASECQDTLETIAQVLLSDTQHATIGSDETSLMKRVNSLCCLLQDPIIASDAQTGERRFGCLEHGNDVCFDIMNGSLHEDNQTNQVFQGNFSENLDFKQASSSPRKDSLSDFLLNLPHIASLPMFLSDIAEDGESQPYK